jgi:hypothetical protein
MGSDCDTGLIPGEFVVAICEMIAAISLCPFKFVAPVSGVDVPVSISWLHRAKDHRIVLSYWSYNMVKDNTLLGRW